MVDRGYHAARMHAELPGPLQIVSARVDEAPGPCGVLTKELRLQLVELDAQGEQSLVELFFARCHVDVSRGLSVKPILIGESISLRYPSRQG